MRSLQEWRELTDYSNSTHTEFNALNFLWGCALAYFIHSLYAAVREHSLLEIVTWSMVAAARRICCYRLFAAASSHCCTRDTSKTLPAPAVSVQSDFVVRIRSVAARLVAAASIPCVRRVQD